MKNILLNWLPPSLEFLPSPALSVLKAYLRQNGYNADIKYWNILFQDLINNFLNVKDKNFILDDNYRYLPFISYLAIHHNDSLAIKHIKYYILSLKPQFNSFSDNYIDNLLLDNYERINIIIDKEIKKNQFDDYLYIAFSTQFYQWIIADIIVDRIRNYYPNIIVVAGGCGTRKEAISLLQNYDNFQYCSWGEGEHSLLQLTNYIEGIYKKDVSDIPNFAFRNENGSINTSKVKNTYADLNESKYDYSDFFKQIEEYKIKIKPRFPIEKGRGCHWRKCHFCFLNAGYKFRIKTTKNIVSEIISAINLYQIYSFYFLDNDLIGNDLVEFNTLLDSLIAIKREYPEFEILMAELITKDVSRNELKKMALAGFKKVQIGYESPSSDLLIKIDKKNTFASNLLCIKWGLHYGIKFEGVNVIRNLIEETEDDIEEGIKNLYFLRFYLSKPSFYHNMSFLAISENSKYYSQISDNERANYESFFSGILPKAFIFQTSKYTLIMDHVNPNYNRLWDVFESVESHYLNNKHSYRLIRLDDRIFYREYYNSVEIKELEFEEKSSIHWFILKKCNNKVLSIEELEKLCTLNDFGEDLFDAIDSLRSEGLLYCNNNKSEVTSVINVELLN